MSAVFAEGLFALLKETFEGPPPKTSSAYLDSGGGLFQILASISAKTASKTPHTGPPSIAAHASHARFYLDVLHRYMDGNTTPADWPGSWHTQTVTPSEWKALQRDLRASYKAVIAALHSVKRWNEKSAGAGMAILAHTAYHLAAIRTIHKLQR